MDAGWKRTTDEGFLDPAAHLWDGVVTTAVADYNRRLKDTPGYLVVDPTVVLAMLWVETNGPKRAEWFRRPMQIGNKGDPGLADLHGRGGLTTKVVAQEVLTTVDALWEDPKKRDIPELNIQGGIAYLWKRMAISDKSSNIVGWRVFDAKTIAERYNGGGDPQYAEKLQYVIDKLNAASAMKKSPDAPWSSDHLSGGGAAGGGGGAW